MKYQIEEAQWPEKTFITKRETVGFDKLSEFFTNNYGAIYGAVQEQEIEATEPPCAIYYEIDEANKNTDVAAAVPISDKSKQVKGFNQLTLPPSKVLTTTYVGPYEGMAAAYNDLDQYAKEHGLNRELIIEEYLSDPAIEKLPANWKTNIYYIVK